MEQVLEIPTARVATEPAVPALAEGVELIGPYKGSGYKEPKYILSRADGQVIQLPALLYALAGSIDGRRDLDQLARRLSTELDVDLAAEQVSYLVEEKLRPAGIMATPAGGDGAGVTRAPQAKLRPDALLLLRYRVPVIPPRVVGLIAAIFQPLFWPPVVVAALVAFVTLDVWLVLTGALGQLVPAATTLVHAPGLVLLVIASILASGMFHEGGHVAACRYGGARPGAIGVGIYLVWPAMYSTVTDAYRLSRIGRLRTDLGGIYFNLIFIAGMSLAYLQTGAPWMLVAVVLMHVETAWQFLPNIRLDGYYILADLVGVPDLFSLIGPVLKSLLPGRPVHPRVAELKPWARRVMTLWVLAVVPILAFWLIWFLILVPRILPTVWAALLGLLDAVGTAVLTGEPGAAALGVVKVLLLLLPWVGISLILSSLGGTIGRVARARMRKARTGATVDVAAANVTMVVTPSAGSAAIAVLRPALWFLAAVGSVVLLAGLGVAAAGRWIATTGEAGIAAAAFFAGRGELEIALSWPDTIGARQVAALQALWPGVAQTPVIDGARHVFLALGLVGCLLVWPLARRLELRAPAVAAVVALCGLPVALHGAVDAGALAVVWLTLAAVMVGRGVGASAAAVAAAVMGVLTAPLAAVGVLAFCAHAACTRLPARGWSPATARAVGAVLAVGALVPAVLATGNRAWSVAGAGSVAPTAMVLASLATAALVVVWSWYAVPALRPVAAVTGPLLICAALPGGHPSTAMLLVLPAFALLVWGLVDGLAAAGRRWPLRLAVATTVVLAILATAPVLATRDAAAGDRGRLSAWIRTEVEPATALLTDPLTAAQLVRDGVSADRLFTDPATAPPGALVIVAQRPGGSASIVAPPGRLLLSVEEGPGGAPTVVYRTGPDPATGPTRPAQLGTMLAGNDALRLTGPAADALRRGEVDHRLATVLAGLATVHELTVIDFPSVPGEPVGTPRRTGLITAVDGVPTSTPGAADLVARWLTGQQPAYRPSAVEVTDGVLIVHYTAPPAPASVPEQKVAK